jgi:hypothetical protein
MVPYDLVYVFYLRSSHINTYFSMHQMVYKMEAPIFADIKFKPIRRAE